MADSAYAQELAQLCPGQVKPVTDWEQALRSHDAEATDLIPADERWQHSWWDVARLWQDLWCQAFKPWFTGQLRPSPTPAQAVSVIIPHYNDETSLQRVVDAIDASRGIDAVEIIVADDGSRALPKVKSSRWPVKVVSQADFGFRAAAARNLGASHARFPILAFVDGDTIPEPDYLARAASWVSADERAVVVGTRLQDGVEPDWLHEAWQRTHDLEWADSSAWRFILSSVLTISRRFFDLLGGFDASLIGYGGEDWELAFRAYNAGGVFVHDPQARAAHLEPDFGERTAHDETERLRLKNAETSALARRITHPLARPDGVIFSRQDIGVWLPPHTPEAVISAWLAAGDVRVTHPVPELLTEDPRVGPGPTRITIEVDQPIGPPQDLAGVVSRVEALGGRGMLYDAHQAYASPIGRVTLRRNDQAHPAKIGVRWAEVTAPAQLERWCAGW
ncbi:glycosyltransferase [Corynebacterium tapiri]|uniref:Glycosyltransferase n=2 Tax=Corynebacterium tapiri TaxID=1448266 RepID=A0A5C4U647_9CORY|nr:glycosyltransferase [Corynebacterium tapiri]